MHGGKRSGAGRRKGQSALLPEAVIDNGFATRVLNRIGEGKPEKITCAEDYALSLLFEADIQTRSYNFNRLVDRKYGKPAQGVFAADTRETTRALDFGDLPMPASPVPGKAGKPN